MIKNIMIVLCSVNIVLSISAQDQNSSLVVNAINNYDNVSFKRLISRDNVDQDIDGCWNALQLITIKMQKIQRKIWNFDQTIDPEIENKIMILGDMKEHLFDNGANGDAIDVAAPFHRVTLVEEDLLLWGLSEKIGKNKPLIDFFGVIEAMPLVDEVLLKNSGHLNVKNVQKLQLLHIAAMAGNVRIVELLLNAGVPIDVQDERNFTPLYYAIAGRDIKTIEFLLKHGANIESLGYRNLTPLNYAIVLGDVMPVKLLLKHGAAIKASCITIDGFMLTSIELAAYGCTKAMVKLLLEYGADIDAKDRFGETSLYRLIRQEGRNGSFDMFKFLVSKGANLQSKNACNETPLELIEQCLADELLNDGDWGDGWVAFYSTMKTFCECYMNKCGCIQDDGNQIDFVGMNCNSNFNYDDLDCSDDDWDN